jgi:hypothetical protein
MKSRDDQPLIPIHDYSAARQSAVAWLGSRYLLAAAVVSRRHKSPETPFYRHWTSWLDCPRGMSLTSARFEPTSDATWREGPH